MAEQPSQLSFGFVIPNLNQTHFLKTALESIKNQDRMTSVALMDGGSNDNIHNVYGEYKALITFFSSQKDGGQSAAIKKGWERISGDIITWLNADDYLFPNILGVVSEYFEREPDLDVVYGDAVHVAADGAFIGYFPAIKDIECAHIGNDNFICQPACFIRRSAYEKITGIDTKLKYTMDWDLWCQLKSSNAKFKYLKQPLAAVRYYEGTKTSTRSFNRYREILKIEKKYGNHLIPTAVLGADYYGLSIINNTSKRQKIYLSTFDFLKRCKRLLKKNKNRGSVNRLYGFSPGTERAFQSSCIHLPWYLKVQSWGHIALEMEPSDEDYEVTINGETIQTSINSRNQIEIPLRRKYAPHIQIAIRSKTPINWKINDFKCI